MAVTCRPFLLVSCLVGSSTMKMEPICSCETSGSLRTARHYNTTHMLNKLCGTGMSLIYLSLLRVNTLRSDVRNCFPSLNLLNSIAFYAGHRLNGSSTLSITVIYLLGFMVQFYCQREKFMLFCCF